MDTRIKLALIAIVFLAGYTRCGQPAPPDNPEVIDVDPANVCLRGDYVRINGNRYENVNTGDVITAREYRRVPDVEVTLEPSQCFRVPDCAGADPLALGYFRSSGFTYVDPLLPGEEPAPLDDAGASLGEMRGGNFINLFNRLSEQQDYLSEIPPGDEPQDALMICARDDASPSTSDFRGWFVVGQTEEDRELNGVGNQNGHAAIRYVARVVENTTPEEPDPFAITLDASDVIVAPGVTVAVGATLTGVASDETAACSWSATTPGLLATADGDATQETSGDWRCEATLELDPAVAVNDGDELGFRVDAERRDAAGLALETLFAEGTAIADIAIVSDPTVTITSSTLFDTAQGRDRDLAATVVGVGSDASSVACAWSAPELTLSPVPGETADAAGRYPAFPETDGSWTCGAVAELPADYIPVDGDTFDVAVEAVVLAADDSVIATSPAANQTLQVSATAFTVDRIRVTPELNLARDGLRPRYDANVTTLIAVEASEAIGRIRAEILGCSTDWAADCNPVETVIDPGVVSFAAAVQLPSITGSDPGRQVDIEVTVEGTDFSVARETVTVDWWPADIGLEIQCRRRQETNGLYIDLTLIDTGALPLNPSTGDPFTIADMFDARWFVYQANSVGWQPDESDNFRGTFVLNTPESFHVVDEGLYQIVFVGQLGFVTPIQTTLTFDTEGIRAADLCPL